jgi:ABC-type bacteriocin/lantibiotic exporter with double-glycine peptidase domain
MLYCYGGLVDKFKYVQIESDIQSALKLCGWIKIAKIFLAALIIFVYFFYPSWLLDVITIAVVFSLLLPLGFFDTFIQKLLEYNTQKSEERQILNATEANEQFENIYKKLGK